MEHPPIPEGVNLHPYNLEENTWCFRDPDSTIRLILNASFSPDRTFIAARMILQAMANLPSIPVQGGSYFWKQAQDWLAWGVGYPFPGERNL